VNELHEVMSWEELGQWCWVQMLRLKRAWQSAPSFCGELPSAESEESSGPQIQQIMPRVNRQAAPILAIALGILALGFILLYRSNDEQRGRR